MKVTIINGAAANIRIWLPTGLVFNRLTALLIPGALAPQGIHVTYAQATAFVKAIADSKRRWRDLSLVEIKDSYGAEIIIKL